MTTFRFPVLPPFDAVRTFAAARFYNTYARPTPDGRALRQLLRLPAPGSTSVAGHALVEWFDASDTGEPALGARLLAADGPIDGDALAAMLRWMAAPEIDYRPFYAFAAGYPLLAETTAVLHGMRLLRFPYVFDALGATIIEQQIALRAAQRAERWLAQTYGSHMAYDGETYLAFPAPAALARLDVADLAPLKITFLRVGRLLALARSISTGDLDLEAARTLPTDAAYRALLALHGVGHWTACWTLIRAHGALLAFGSADVALRAAVNHYAFGQTGRAEIAAFDVLFASFGAFAGAASVFLIMRWAFDRYASVL
jgi:3-methyladenine DNA glycosylase/8-oxoguanine DNA glycosylase